MKKEKQIKQTTMDILMKRPTPSQEEPKQVLQAVFQKKGCPHRSGQLPACYCPEDLPVGQDVEAGDCDVDGPDPVEA